MSELYILYPFKILKVWSFCLGDNYTVELFLLVLIYNFLRKKQTNLKRF